MIKVVAYRRIGLLVENVAKLGLPLFMIFNDSMNMSAGFLAIGEL